MADEKFIKDIIKSGESEALEIKQNVRKETVAQTVCSFLNGKGGQLLIGVGDSGEIIGIKNAEKKSKELQQFLFNAIVPEPAVTVSVEEYGQKEVLSVKVWSGSKEPYVFDGSIFYRRGSQTVKASSQEISELIHNRQQFEIKWERQTVLNAELNDLDLDEINATIEAAIKNVGNKDIHKDPIEFLSHYGLFSNGSFTNAAIVLFAKNPVQFLPQCRVRLSYLQAGKTGASFTDDRVLEGNLFKNFDAIEEFFFKHLQLRRNFSNSDWQRTDDLQYPLLALREGVLNALIHRDYSNQSGSISIVISPDKLEITNFGKLELKLSELKKTHLSVLVNPDIAHIVFIRGYIEKIGRGTLKIIEDFKNAGLKNPVWSSDSNSVKLTFFSDVQSDKLIDGTVDGTVGGIIDGTIDGTTNEVKQKLSDLLLEIYKNEGKKAKDYAQSLNVSQRTIERYVKHLTDSDLIEFKGTANQTGGYYVTEKVKSKINRK